MVSMRGLDPAAASTLPRANSPGEKDGSRSTVRTPSRCFMRLALSLEKAAEVAGESTPMGSRLTNLVSLARQALIEVRHYMFDPKPLLAGDASLVSTVRGQAKEFQTVSGLPTEVVVTGDEPELPVATQTTIYRMVQEALANAFRHAMAAKVVVRLTFQPKWLQLEVEDDGRGFD
ncbi:MAG: sensor histidine kinase, partial [Dehalococcoidia bacterium]